ncbi:hypothetical protein [Actinoplanes sp. NPDC049802]|uniref:hypothetical protein n=1 Tax=Actinoplanes sp. NPDC049802 TaxID=3154742 RepID=UPI0033C5EEB7
MRERYRQTIRLIPDRHDVPNKTDTLNNSHPAPALRRTRRRTITTGSGTSMSAPTQTSAVLPEGSHDASGTDLIDFRESIKQPLLPGTVDADQDLAPVAGRELDDRGAFRLNSRGQTGRTIVGQRSSIRFRVPVVIVMALP